MQRPPAVEMVHANRGDGESPCGAPSDDCGCGPPGPVEVLRVPAAGAAGFHSSDTKMTVSGKGRNARHHYSAANARDRARSGTVNDKPTERPVRTQVDAGSRPQGCAGSARACGPVSRASPNAGAVPAVYRSIAQASSGTVRPVQHIRRGSATGVVGTSAVMGVRSTGMLQSQVGRRPVGEVNFGCLRPPTSLPRARGPGGDLVDVIIDTSSVNMSVAERAASQVTATPLDLDDMRRGLTLYSPVAGWETTRRTITTTVEATPGYELTRQRAPFVEDPVVWRRMPTITNRLYFGLGDLLRTLARRAGCVMVNFPPGRATWRSPAGLCPVPALGKSREPEADGLFTYAFRPEMLGKRFLDVSVVVSVNSIGQPKNEANRLQLPGYEGVYAGVGYKDERMTTQVPFGDSMVFAGGGDLFPFLGNTGPKLSRGGGFTTIGKTVEFASVASDEGLSPIRDLRGGESWGTLVYRPADRNRAVPIETRRYFLIPILYPVSKLTRWA